MQRSILIRTNSMISLLFLILREDCVPLALLSFLDFAPPQFAAQRGSRSGIVYVFIGRLSQLGGGHLENPVFCVLSWSTETIGRTTVIRLVLDGRYR